MTCCFPRVGGKNARQLMFFSGVGELHQNNRSVRVAPRPRVEHEATIQKKSLLPASDWLPLSPTCCSLLLKADCKSTLKETESPSASSSLQSECEIKCHIQQTGGGFVTAECRVPTKTELSNNVHTEEPVMEDVSGLEKDGEAPYSTLKGPRTNEFSGLEILKRSAALRHRLLC